VGPSRRSWSQGFPALGRATAVRAALSVPTRQAFPEPQIPGPTAKAARLAKWVRPLGVDQPDVKPNRGWRHTLKNRALQAGIDMRMRHAIVWTCALHAGQCLRTSTAVDMAKALKRFPRYAHGA
jgi:hypothetical protein